MFDGKVLPFSLHKKRGSGELETGVKLYHEHHDRDATFMIAKFKVQTSKGNPVVYYMSGATRFVTTNVHSAAAYSVAGVCVVSGSVAAGGYAWVQTHGPGRVPLRVTGTVNANALLVISGAAGEAIAKTATGAVRNAFATTLGAKSGTHVPAGEYIIKGLT